MPMQYTVISKVVKNEKFSVENFRYFSNFCSKHRLWVHVRTAYIKVGFEGVYFTRTCFPDAQLTGRVALLLQEEASFNTKANI